MDSKPTAVSIPGFGFPLPSPSPQVVDRDEYIKKLQAALAAYDHNVQIARGMLVKWKPGLKNTIRPAYNEPAIVIEILQQPIRVDTEPFASPYFRQQLDLVLGLINQEGDLVTFHYEKQRFEPF